MDEEEIKEEKWKEVTDNLGEVEVKANEGEILAFSTNHPQKSHEHLSLFLTSGEPLPKVSNPDIRAF